MLPTPQHGFVRRPDGTYLSLDAPGSFVGFNQNFFGINNDGQISGLYLGQNGNLVGYHGFIATPSAYTAVVQQPIDAGGSSVFNANRGVVPIKFTLTLNGTPTCNLPPATISLTRTAGGTIGPVNENTFSQASDSGSNFRIDNINCQYVYNLSTSSLGTGTYQGQIIIANVPVGNANFGLQ